MNIKKSARQLESFYEDFKDKLPFTLLPNKAVGYHDYIVRPNKDNGWDLLKKYPSGPSIVDTFNLKVCALICAKYHENTRIQQLIEIKEMDRQYSANETDATYFRYFYNKTTDPVRRDTFLWRYEITTEKTKFYKDKISSSFKNVFR